MSLRILPADVRTPVSLAYLLARAADTITDTPNISSSVKIKSINMIKRHTKPTKENKGGIISKESFIHQSNIKNIDVEKKIKKEKSKK